MANSDKDDDLEDFFNSGVEKIEALEKQAKKDAEKKPVKKVEVSEDDRILYDLLGAYAGKRAAQAMDARVKSMTESRVPPAPRIEPTMSPATGAQPQGMPRPVAGGPAGPVGGPASPLAQMGGQSLVPTDAMNTRQMQGTTVDGASGRARQNTYNENTAQQAASKRAQESLSEIGKTITTWPQLATDVNMGGAFAAKIVRQILLGDSVHSGRFRLDIIEHFKSNANHQTIQQVKHA